LELDLETWKYARYHPKYTLNSFISLMDKEQDIQLYVGLHEEQKHSKHDSVSSDEGGADDFDYVKNNFVRKRHIILALEYHKGTIVEEGHFDIRYVMSFSKATFLEKDKIVLESEHSRRIGVLTTRQKTMLSEVLDALRANLADSSFQAFLKDLPEWNHLQLIPLELVRNHVGNRE
jgi:uncharacterized protein YbcV (DUF1398 family)